MSLTFHRVLYRQHRGKKQALIQLLQDCKYYNILLAESEWLDVIEEEKDATD